MIVIESPKISKYAQADERKPWELSEDEEEYLEPIGEVPPPFGEPATEEDFRTPRPAAPPEPDEPAGPEPGFEIKPTTDYTFLPFAPTPDDEIPINPEQFVGEEVEIPTTPIEDANATLDIRGKIFYSLNNSTPMRISYTTIDGGSVTDRTIHPDYVYWAGTNRHILVAWDELRGDWRAFAVNNITLAELQEETV